MCQETEKPRNIQLTIQLQTVKLIQKDVKPFVVDILVQ